jgi:hypothetical protein
LKRNYLATLDNIPEAIFSQQVKSEKKDFSKSNIPQEECNLFSDGKRQVIGLLVQTR